MQLKTKNATFAPKATRIKICVIIHNWTPILIQCVSKRVSSFFFVKSLICKVFSILFNDNRLYSDSETVAAEPVCFSLYILYNERSVGCASFNDYHFTV